MPNESDEGRFVLMSQYLRKQIVAFKKQRKGVVQPTGSSILAGGVVDGADSLKIVES